MNNTHFYEVNLTWNTATQGTLSSPVITEKHEKPPEIPKNVNEKWTPEHLFVSAVNCCLMSTFLLIADNSKFQFISFESKATGKVKKIEGRFVVTEIVLTPKLIIPTTQNATKAKRLLKMSEKACAITNSIKTKITLKPMITI